MPEGAIPLATLRQAFLTRFLVLQVVPQLHLVRVLFGVALLRLTLHGFALFGVFVGHDEQSGVRGTSRSESGFVQGQSAGSRGQRAESQKAGFSCEPMHATAGFVAAMCMR